MCIRDRTAANVLVAIQVETTTGVAGAAASAAQMRITDSPGLKLDRAVVQSNEKRDDGFRTMGRIGGKSVSGSYNAEVSPGGVNDMMLEAIMRSTWATAVAIPFASMTDVALSTSTIVASGGDFLVTHGVRVGDVFKITGTTTTVNHDANIRIVSAATLLSLIHI